MFSVTPLGYECLPGEALSGVSRQDAIQPFTTRQLVLLGTFAAVSARWHPSAIAVLVAAIPNFVVAVVCRSRRARWAGGKACSALCLVALVSARSNALLAARHVLPGRVTFHAVLKSDPNQTGGVTSAVVAVGPHLLRATARSKAGSDLGLRSAGDQVEGVGTVSVPRDRSWRIAKHLSGDIAISKIESWSAGSRLARFSNAIRRTLLVSSGHFGRTDRALFAGFVLGDPRGQPVWVTDDFRASGLTHLLVVSGQNVAFTLAVVRPLLMRLRRNARFCATLAVLFVFASVTRFEPSVMRAVVMAALASGALSGGRPQRSLRVLALSVCVLMAYDPLLAWSVGFGLSVGACVGLAVITPRLEPLLPGPRWFAAPLATTLGAQVGTSVIMIPLFGGIPVVSVLANFLALPAAEPVMSWGIAVGVPTGIARHWLGSWPSRVAQAPTELCLWWVRGVAKFCARIPLGDVQSAHMFAAAIIVLAAHHRWRIRLWVPWLLVLVSAGPVVGASLHPPNHELAVAAGALAIGPVGRVQRRAAIVILDHGARPNDVLQGLRRARIAAIDVLVVRSGGRPQADVVTAIAERVDVAEIIVGDRAFAGHVRPLIVARPGLTVRVERETLRVDTVAGGRLSISVGNAR